ncbi:MAG TPA: radical SAM protein [Terriglobales bacterium]
MTTKTRPYLFYDTATSICSKCFRRVDAKIVFRDDRVLMLKRCPEHGSENILMADDVDYYRKCREVFLKAPEQAERYNTPTRWGCPYDCGLCPDHEQHSCLSLLEITDHCNLRCPTCYAASGPERVSYRSLEQIEFMLDAIVGNEREPDVVQISGGEPTLHPQFFEVLDAAKRRPIRHLMVNTNGLRIAAEEDFVARLASYMPDFELYLQFDSFKEDALRTLRGADLRKVRERALERLSRHGISTTLVMTLQRGVNDDEIGAVLDYAVQQPCVRGVALQPTQVAGRYDNFDPEHDRLTLTEVRRRVYEQTSLFKPEDIIPVPCHPDSLAMAYALKVDGEIVPLTSMVPPQVLIEGGRNTIIYEQDAQLQKHIFKTFSTNHSPQSGASTLHELLCCLPQVDAPALSYENVFRVIIMQFIDAYSFDLRSIKKTCVHICHPDGRLIPFDTYNLFYRDELEQTRLAPLRARAEMYG